MLEIGCGWGGFAEYAAAERGLNVTGLTISQEQHDYAVDRISRAGLTGTARIELSRSTKPNEIWGISPISVLMKVFAARLPGIGMRGISKRHQTIM